MAEHGGAGACAHETAVRGQHNLVFRQVRSPPLADRLAFVYWALALATVYTLLLRHGLAAGWGDARLAGALALLLAAGFAGFALLEQAHGEILDLGFRALLPDLYQPATTAPATAFVVALALGLAGAAALLLSRRRV